MTDAVLSENISGLILFHENVYQKAVDGTAFPELIKKKVFFLGSK